MRPQSIAPRSLAIRDSDARRLADAEASRKDKTGAYLKGNLLLFGGLSYLHLFTLLVGVYLTTMMKASLRHLPPSLRTPRITRATDHIQRAPDSIPPPTMHLQPRPWMIVEDEASSAFDESTPLRALSKPEETIFRIPGRKQ